MKKTLGLGLLMAVVILATTSVVAAGDLDYRERVARWERDSFTVTGPTVPMRPIETVGTGLGIVAGAFAPGWYKIPVMLGAALVGNGLGKMVDDLVELKASTRAEQSYRWYRDSSGKEEWQEWGRQTRSRLSPPYWVGEDKISRSEPE